MSVESENVDKTSYKILVVDEDHMTRSVLIHMLGPEGYVVDEAEDGVQAVAEYIDFQPDMVLLDAKMPEMSWFKIYTQLRELPGGDVQPIFMLITLNDDASKKLASQIGVNDFITKPINKDALCLRIRRLLYARRTEILLNETRVSTQTVMDHVQDGIITIQANGLITSINSAAEIMFGYEAQEVIGFDISILLPQAIRKIDQRNRTNLNNKEGFFKASREATGRSKNGLTFPILMTICGFQGGKQLLTIQDITNLKQSEEKLRTAGKVFESINEGIMVNSVGGVIQAVNPAFTAITGYSEQEAVGKRSSFLNQEDALKETEHKIWTSLLDTGQWKGKVWYRRKGGELFPANLSISAVRDTQGRVSQYINVFVDATEQMKIREEHRKLQEQMARSQRLTSLGTMSAGIAHEINQPLNSIKVITDGIIYWHNKGHVQDVAAIIEKLKKVSAQADRINDIITHMRSFVSIEKISDLVPCDINQAVNGAIDMLGRQLASHGITLKIELEPGSLLVLGNANRLEELVINLLVNAKQALDIVMNQDKVIICRTWAKSSKAYLEISDNAVGIRQEIMERIFDPFFSTKESGSGMGLGLSIAQSIVTGFHGAIRVTNNQSGGATFTVELPAIES